MKRITFAGWFLIVLVVASLVGIFYVTGCEATVPLRPEVAEAAGLPPLTADKKPVEVPLSSYPAIEAVYEKKQAAKAEEKRAEAATIAAAAEVKIVKATRNTSREIRRLQEQLEDDTEAERAKVGLAARDAETAIARINAETASTKALQAQAVEAAKQRQAVIDQIASLGIGAAQTAAATQAGTPWGGLLVGGLGIVAAAWKNRQASIAAAMAEQQKAAADAAKAEADKANSALDAVTSGIEEAKALPNVPAPVLAAIKAEIAKQSQPGDITTIETSIARQNYAAKV